MSARCLSDPEANSANDRMIEAATSTAVGPELLEAGCETLAGWGSSTSMKFATKLLETGEVPRDKSLDPTSHAAWTQLSATLLASDLALMMF